jgi:hypothetical protein
MLWFGLPFKGCLKNFSTSGQTLSSTAYLKQCRLSSCINENEIESGIAENDVNLVQVQVWFKALII